MLSMSSSKALLRVSAVGNTLSAKQEAKKTSQSNWGAGRKADFSPWIFCLKPKKDQEESWRD